MLFSGDKDMDFIEIMDFCGYDLQAADDMAKAEFEITPDMIAEALEDSALD